MPFKLTWKAVLAQKGQTFLFLIKTYNKTKQNKKGRKAGWFYALFFLSGQTT